MFPTTPLAHSLLHPNQHLTTAGVTSQTAKQAIRTLSRSLSLSICDYLSRSPFLLSFQLSASATISTSYHHYQYCYQYSRLARTTLSSFHPLIFLSLLRSHHHGLLPPFPQRPVLLHSLFLPPLFFLLLSSVRRRPLLRCRSALRVQQHAYAAQAWQCKRSGQQQQQQQQLKEQQAGSGDSAQLLVSGGDAGGNKDSAAASTTASTTSPSSNRQAAVTNSSSSSDNSAGSAVSSRSSQQLPRLLSPLSLLSPFSSAASLLSSSAALPSMSVDMLSTDAEYTVHASVPGVAKQDLKVTVDDGVLTIEAERREETKHSGGQHQQQQPSAASPSSTPSSSPSTTAHTDEKQREEQPVSSTAPTAASSDSAPMDGNDDGNQPVYHHVESFYGHISRSITLPDDCHTAGMTARYEDGVLKISIPRVQERRQRATRLEIQ